MKKVRLPITSGYNTRSSSVNALSSSSGIVGIGIVGSMIVGQSVRSSDKDVRYINCFPITVADEIAQTKRTYIVKRPGFVVSITPSAGNKGAAAHVWVGQGSGEKIITAFGHTNSTIYDSTTSLGAITGRCTGITETILSGTATLAISSNDSTGWYYQASGSLTKITDSDFPGNASRTLVGTFAHLDGYPFIMDNTGRVYNGDLNSITAWTTNSYFTANSVPDIGVGVVRHRNTLIAFCKQHFEVLYNNPQSGTGSPLSRMDQATQQIGCVSADAIASIRDAIIWAGSSKQANVGIYLYDGAKTEKVSNPEIEAQLSIAGAANITLTAAGAYGRHFVIVKASNTSFGYCLEERCWFELNSTTPLWYKADGVTTGSSMFCYFISDVSTSGKVWVFNPAAISYQDDGSAFTATIQTAEYDSGNHMRKFWSSLEVIADRETSTSTLSIAHYDDDYLTASSARTVDLSTARAKIDRCGSSRRRSWVLSHSANTPMRIEALDLTFQEGTN